MIGVEDPAPEAFAELLKRLAADREAAENCGDSLDFFIDAVSGSGENASLSREQGKFLLAAAACGIPDSAPLRKVLAEAVRMGLPPYLAKTPVVRATGVRDNNVPLASVAKRTEVLFSLTNGMVVYLRENNKWASVSNINVLTAAIVLTGLPGGGELSMPLSAMLEQAVLFMPGVEVLRIADGSRKPVFSADEYRTIDALCDA